MWGSAWEPSAPAFLQRAFSARLQLCCLGRVSIHRRSAGQAGVITTSTLSINTCGSGHSFSFLSLSPPSPTSFSWVQLVNNWQPESNSSPLPVSLASFFRNGNYWMWVSDVTSSFQSFPSWASQCVFFLYSVHLIPSFVNSVTLEIGICHFFFWPLLV